MALDSDENRIIYVGNNSNVTLYPVTFRFDDNEWLKVTRTDADGTSTTIPEGLETTGFGAFEVIEVSPDTFSIRSTVAVPVTSTLTISRLTPATQTLSLVPNSPLPAKDLEAALDRLMMIIQDRSFNGLNPFSTALLFPIDEDTDNLTELPSAQARLDKVIYFDDTTGEMTLVDKADLFTVELAAAAVSAAAAASSAINALNYKNSAETFSLNAAVSETAALASANTANGAQINATARAGEAGADADAAAISAAAAAASAVEASTFIFTTETVTESTTARTLALTDASKYIRCTNASPTVITIPVTGTGGGEVDWVVGSEIYFRRATGAGALSLSIAGVTVNNSAIASISAGQTFCLKHLGSSVWDFI